MRTYIDCIPCFVRQALSAARPTSDDETIHEKALRAALKYAADLDFNNPPPVMGGWIHRVVSGMCSSEKGHWCGVSPPAPIRIRGVSPHDRLTSLLIVSW